MHVDQGCDRPGRRGPAKAKNKDGRGPSWFNTPRVTVADPGREFAYNRKGPGIGSYTFRYVFESTADGARVTESYNAEKPLGPLMTKLTELRTGSKDRDADLHDGMTTTLARIKVVGPWEVSLAMRNTASATLGDFAEGWAEFGDFRHDGSVCRDAHVLHRWTVDAIDPPSLALDAGARVVNSFGTTHRRHLAARGEYEGQFDPRFGW